MNPRVKIIAIIILISLCFLFGFKKISHYINEPNNKDIQEYKILSYIPSDNKLLFISNIEISKMIKNLKKKYDKKDFEKIMLIKNSILGYLGIDLGKNKLEDIYNNEIAVSTYNNDENIKDDILIVFKIKEDKKLNDLLNLTNYNDDSDEIISIYRERKLNYLKFIYRTNDDYIIASSNKKLILDSMDFHDDFKKEYNNYSSEITKNFVNQKNILINKKSSNKLFKNNISYPQINEDLIATTFELKEKDIILKSYLVNDKKKLNISNYTSLINKNSTDTNDYQLSIFTNLKNSLDYINDINQFEKEFLEELVHKLKNNVLLLSSNRDWIIIFENKNEKKLQINSLEQIKQSLKYREEINNNIYSIYSKNYLKFDENTIKQISYKDIFSVESDNLTALSNNLNMINELDELSKEFFDLNSKTDERDFLYQRLYMKDSDANLTEYFSHFSDLNFLFNNIVKFTNKEFMEIISQSFPEKTPLLYKETSFKLFS